MTALNVPDDAEDPGAEELHAVAGGETAAGDEAAAGQRDAVDDAHAFGDVHQAHW